MNNETDLEEISRLFQECYGLMLTVARRYVPPDGVYDVVQQASIDFLSYARRGKLDPNRNVTSLLLRITKVCAIEYYEKRKRQSSEVLCEIADALAAEPEDSSEPYRKDELSRLRRCMEELPAKSRDMIRRHYERGVSMEEIARSCDRNVVTVRSTFHRIRLKLKECIERKSRMESES